MEWVLVQMKRDKWLKLHVNRGPERLGHTILYDTLINDYATHDSCYDIPFLICI